MIVACALIPLLGDTPTRHLDPLVAFTNGQPRRARGDQMFRAAGHRERTRGQCLANNEWRKPGIITRIPNFSNAIAGRLRSITAGTPYIGRPILEARAIHACAFQQRTISAAWSRDPPLQLSLVAHLLDAVTRVDLGAGSASKNRKKELEEEGSHDVRPGGSGWGIVEGTMAGPTGQPDGEQ